jgi:hypothetical protein
MNKLETLSIIIDAGIRGGNSARSMINNLSGLGLEQYQDQILLNIVKSLARLGNSYQTITNDLLSLGLPANEIENAIAQYEGGK